MTAEAQADNPRHDAHFVDRVVWDLITHPGIWRRLGRLHAPGAPSFERCTAVRDAVNHARRIGFLVEADRRRGYRVTGYRHPARIYTCKPGPKPADEAPDEIPGQLSLTCCEA